MSASRLETTQGARTLTARRRLVVWASLLAVLFVLHQTITTAMPINPSADHKSRKEKKKVPPSAIKPAAADEKECPSCEQIAALGKRVEELSQQVEALTTKLALASKLTEDTDTRREIAELKARLKAAEERTALSASSTFSSPASTTALAYNEPSAASSTNVVETKLEPAASSSLAASPKTESAPTPPAAQTAQADDLVKRFGPFRFSGDFRLRADAVLRPAFDNPGPGQTALQHVQNVRARYRLRLNFDTELNSKVSFHGQLATGPVNNPLTLDQDFAGVVAHHPFFLNEVWIDVHPTKSFSVQGGRVPNVFADNSRFVFDDDIRFNGFNEKFVHAFKETVAGFKSIELRAGQYIFSNPNVAVVTAGNLGPTGAVIGSTGRAAQMFHQGLLFNQQVSENASQQFGGDIQFYRNPNQIQFASTATGFPIILQNGLSIALAGPLPGTGNATTTSGGAIYTARSFQIARLTYRLDHRGFKSGNREYPISFNVQVARNLGVGQRERDALLASLKVGNVKNRGDQSFLYVFTIKGANALISQLTDDDLGTISGVNMRAHHFRYDIGVAKGIQLQSLFFIQNQLRSSGQYPNFFVPLGAFTPRQFRIQEQIVFTF